MSWNIQSWIHCNLSLMARSGKYKIQKHNTKILFNELYLGTEGEDMLKHKTLPLQILHIGKTCGESITSHNNIIKLTYYFSIVTFDDPTLSSAHLPFESRYENLLTLVDASHPFLISPCMLPPSIGFILPRPLCSIYLSFLFFVFFDWL